MDITTEVHTLYWEEDKNCAMTTLSTLGKKYDLKISHAFIDSLIAMPGLGTNGLTCGIVVGAIMFMGLYGKNKGYEEEAIKQHTNQLIKGFVEKFGSEQCSILRPEGFKPTNPPHLCEGLTVKGIEYIDDYIRRHYK